MKPAERRLRERFPDLLEALKRSPAMAPYLHDLAVLHDPRGKPERIEAAVREHIGALQHISSGSITSALEGRLAARLQQTSLAAVPSLPAIRKYVGAFLQKDEISPPGISHSSCSLAHASTIGST